MLCDKKDCICYRKGEEKNCIHSKHIATICLRRGKELITGYFGYSKVAEKPPRILWPWSWTGGWEITPGRKQ